MSNYNNVITDFTNMYGSMEEYEKWLKEDKAKQYLAKTDYVVIKMQEYALLNKTVDNDYTEILQKREEARNVLRRMEV